MNGDNNKPELNSLESPNIFISGWRPCLCWICNFCLAWNWGIQPMVTYFYVLFTHHMPQVPDVPMQDVLTLLGTVLFTYGFRTYEKMKGISK